MADESEMTIEVRLRGAWRVEAAARLSRHMPRLAFWLVRAGLADPFVRVGREPWVRISISLSAAELKS